jgi:predicted acetyltransferase
LPWLLADPRRLKQTFNDASWIRVVDVPAALSARTYSADDGLVIQVRDPFLDWNDGKVLLEGGPEGAQCTQTDREPDITLSAADLGAAYLGGVKFQTMSHAGRVEENTPGALRRADAMFATDLMPWCIDSW